MHPPNLPYRLLIGPIYDTDVLGDYLFAEQIKTFGIRTQKEIKLSQHHPISPGGHDLYLNLESDSFSDLLQQLPPDWEPDLVIWYNLAVQALPPGIESCPYPTAVIVHDWHLAFQPSWDLLAAFDYIFCDRALLKLLQSQGVQDCEYWPCYGFNPTKFWPPRQAERIYDLSFIGRFNAVRPERARLLQSLLQQWGQHYRFFISDEHFDADYLTVLQRSKLVFNLSVRGEMNLRAYEAPACGALLLMESSNLEIRDFLTDRVSCVLYTPDNLSELVHYYLTHEAERQQIAQTGQTEIQNHSYTRQFQRLIEKIPAVLSAAQHQRRVFLKRPPRQQALILAQKQLYANTPEGIKTARQTLKAQALATPSSGESLYAYGVSQLAEALPAEGLYRDEVPHDRELLQQAKTTLEKAGYLAPQHPLILYHQGLANLALKRLPQAMNSLQQAQSALTQTGLQHSGEMLRFIFPLELSVDAFDMAWQHIWALSKQDPHRLYVSLEALLKARIYLALGCCYLPSYPVRAANAFAQAFAVMPEDPELHTLYLKSLKRTKHWTQYESLCQYALQADPLNGLRWFEYGQFLREQQRWPELEELLKAYRSRFESNRWHSGKTTAARRFYQNLFDSAELLLFDQSQ